MSNETAFDFADAHVLVTGGSSGIGFGIATAFAEAGAHVTVTGTRARASDYRAPSDVRRSAVDLSGFAYRQLRVTEAREIEAVAASLERLDVLVNNAGANLPGGRNEALPDVFEESVSINLFSAYRMSIACRGLLRASALVGGASVVNLASMSSFFAVPIVPGYGAAKAGVVQMTKNLGVAWAKDRVRVNAVAPGLVETNMTAVMKGIEVLEKPHLDRTPMRRWGTPQDIAPAVLFLSSASAAFITGQTLNVDGGYSAA